LDQIETREVETVSYRPRRDLFFWPVAVALLVTLATQALKLLAGRGRLSGAATAARLRVNPRTFELETIET
jgi:Ca-activated chloride channel family protein